MLPTEPRQLLPTDSAPLPPTSKPGIGATIDVGRLPTLPSNPEEARLPIAPMPPEMQTNVVRTSALVPKSVAGSGEELEIAPMPPEMPHPAQ